MDPLTPEIVRQWLADAPQLANDRSCKVRGLINTLTWLASDWLEKEAALTALVVPQLDLDRLERELAEARAEIAAKDVEIAALKKAAELFSDAADRFEAQAKGKAAPPALCKSHEALRADRDRLREERDERIDDYVVATDSLRQVMSDLDKLREEIAAKDAEIDRLHEMKLEKGWTPTPR